MKTISMTAYNRPDYLKNTLTDLSKNKPKDWHFFISVDPSNRTAEIEQVLQEDYGFASKTIVINSQRKNHRKNQHDAIAMAFGAGSSFNLHFDDDLFIGVDALELASFYERTFKDNPLTFNSYGLFNYDSSPDNPNQLVSRVGTFTGLGWACFRENFEKVFQPNWFYDDLARQYFGSYGWDWAVAAKCKQASLAEIFPSYSRTNHRGREHGTCCSHEWHDKAFANLKWNKNLIIKDYYYE